MRDLWCVEDPAGELVQGTLSDSRSEALDGLFDFMPGDFRSRYWKAPSRSRSAYRRLGYRAVRVQIVKVDEPNAR